MWRKKSKWYECRRGVDIIINEISICRRGVDIIINEISITKVLLVHYINI